VVAIWGAVIDSIKDAEGIATGCGGHGDGVIATTAESEVGTGDGVVGVI